MVSYLFSVTIIRVLDSGKNLCLDHLTFLLHLLERRKFIVLVCCLKALFLIASQMPCSKSSASSYTFEKDSSSFLEPTRLSHLHSLY